MTEDMIPIVMFISMAVVFIAIYWFRYRAKGEMQQTIRMALDKGHELTPEIIDRLGHTKVSKYRDLRFGTIWLAIAFAFVLIGFAVPHGGEDVFRGMLAGAALPLSIGIAYLILYRFTSRDT